MIQFCSFVSVSSEDAPYIQFDYNFDQVEVCTVDGMFDFITFELDSSGTVHVFYVLEVEETQRLFYSHNTFGGFSEPVELLVMDTGCQQMLSRIDGMDHIHLIWLDETGEHEDFLGNIHYMEIENGVILNNRVVHEDRNAFLLDMDIETDGDIHISFDYLNYEEYDFYIGYLYSQNKVLQPLVTRLFDPNDNYHTHFSMKVTPDGQHAYFIGNSEGLHPGSELYLLEYSDGNFKDLVMISDLNADGYPWVPQLALDLEGNLHAYFAQWGLFVPYPIWHSMSSDGQTWTEADMISSVPVYLQCMQDPICFPDNSMALVNYFIEHHSGFFYNQYIQVDRGFGYGNPRLINPAFSRTFTDTFVPIMRNKGGYIIYTLSVRVTGGYPTDTAQLIFMTSHLKNYEDVTIELHTVDTWQLTSLNYSSTMRAALDIYNPRETPVEAELVMVTEFCTGELRDIYYYLSDVNGFPTFQLDYYSFPLTIPPGWWIQNVPIFEQYLGPLWELDKWSWCWYAALLDPATGELIGDLSCYRSSIGWNEY